MITAKAAPAESSWMRLMSSTRLLTVRLHVGVAAALLAVAVLFHQADVLIGLSQDVLNIAQPPVQILGQGVAEGHDAAAVHHEECLVDTLGEPVVLRHHLSQGVGDGLKALLREMNPLTDLPLLVHPLLQDQHADDMGAVADGLYRLDDVLPFSWVTAFICLVPTPRRKVRATAGSFSGLASSPTTVFL